MRQPSRRVPSRLPRLALVAFAALPLLGWTFAAEEPKTELERLDVAMNRARDLIRNATMKLKNGVVSGMREQDSAAPDTPAQRCCSGNLDGLAESYRRIGEALERIETCYEERDVTGESLDMLDLAREDLDTLERVTGNFARAGDARTAGGGLAAMQRSFINLKKSRDGLLEDCPVQ